MGSTPTFWCVFWSATTRLSSKKRAGALGTAVAVLTLFNARALIVPRTDARRNAPYQAALWLKTVTPEDAWVAAYGMGQVYWPYFAGRKPLTTYRLAPSGRRALQRYLSHMESIIQVTRDTLER